VLWGEMNGYRQIRPSRRCPGSGISAIAVGLLTVAARRLAVMLTAVGLPATVAGLIITIEAGLFGLRRPGAPLGPQIAVRRDRRSRRPSRHARWPGPGRELTPAVSCHAGHR
jgi:hypothetical protein